MQITDEMIERLTIREMIENWVLWRDALMWKEFRSLWHDDGRMMATWTQGTADEFIEMSKQGFAKGVRILHFLGGSTIEVRGTRAFSQTKMTIAQRALVHDVMCDVVCTGRFCDFWEKRAGRWGLVLRQPIYEKDRMDPVDPAAKLSPRSKAPRHIPRGLSPSRLPANADRLQNQNGHARPHRPRSRKALRPRRLLALRRPAVARTHCVFERSTCGCRLPRSSNVTAPTDGMMSSRIGRLEFLFWCAAPIVVGSIALAIFGGANARVDGSPLHGLFLVVILVASVTILKAGVSRFHDLGWPGWVVVLTFVPLADIVMFLILLFMPGQKMSNAYGEPSRFFQRWRKPNQEAKS